MRWWALLLVGCASPAAAVPAPSQRAFSPAPPFPENAFQEPARAPVADRFSPRTIGPREEGRRWTGRRVTMDLKSVELSEAFRLLADVGKVNIVVSGDVSGSVTLKLKDVPWDQALHVIASTRNLSVERDGNVYLVRTSSSTP